KSVKQISKEQDRRHPFIIHHGKDEDETDNKKPRDRFFRLPIKRLETRILETAEHHKGKKKHERWQNELPIAEVMFAFGQPEQEESDGCDETGSGGNGRAGEIFLVISVVGFVIGRRRVETRQTQGTACEIDKRDNPAGAREFLENDPINHQSWRDAE